MSVEAIGWAFSVKIKPSSLKFLLVALANNAMAETGLAWPSIDYLANATGMDRKTVVNNLANLRDQGLITDTGKRVGATKQIPVYRLNMPGIGPVPSPSAEPSKEAQKGNSTEGGTVPVLAGNSTEIPLEQSQKRDTEPLRTVKEPSGDSSRAQAPKQARRTRLALDTIPDEWVAYCRERHPQHSPQREFEAFADHHRAKGTTMLDWTAAWRTWLRNADRFSQKPRASPPAGKYADTIAALTGRNRQPEPETIDVHARELAAPRLD